MKNIWLYGLAYFFVISLISFLYIDKSEPWTSFSSRFNDVNFKLQKKKPSPNIVFVAIDEQSVNKFGRWPWNRTILAKGIQKLQQADVVLLDMIFSEKTQAAKDEALANAISGLHNSVCGFFLRNNSTQQLSDALLDVISDSALDYLHSEVLTYNSPAFLASKYAELNTLLISNACTLSGTFSTVMHSDYLIRSYPVALYFNDLLYPSLAVQGLRLKLNSDVKRAGANSVILGGKKIIMNPEGFVRLNFYKKEDYNIVSFLDLIENKIPPEYFAGKMVILGITEVGAGDIVSTPIGSIPGPLLHYTFLSNFLQNKLIIDKPNWTLFLIIFLPFLSLVLVLKCKKNALRIASNISLYFLAYIIVKYLFISKMLYIDLFFPLLSMMLAAVSFELIAFSLQQKNEKFVKNAFSSYLSADLLQQLIENPQLLSLGGEKKQVSVLFSDIRSFTTLCETMSAEKLVLVLNEYFTPMTNVILKNEGMVDKYIGDAIMAFYNAPLNIPNHADKACQSALEMRIALSELNKDFASKNLQAIQIGIGINTDEVVVGNMGSQVRFNYTIIGDGVNLASRVESLTKYYGVGIIITEFTVATLQEDFLYRKIEKVSVKGKKEPVLLYELMQDNPQNRELKEVYERALSYYIKGDSAAAKKMFDFTAQNYNDTLSRYFINNINKGKFYGINIMQEK